MQKKCLLSATLLFFVWGCAQELPLPSQPAFELEDLESMKGAIIDGSVDTETTGAVLLFYYPAPYAPYPLCTGTLIAPNLVLTAQHCVADLVDYNTCGYGETYAPLHLLVSTAGTASNLDNLYEVMEIHVPSPEDTPPVCGNDIALLALSGEISEEEATPFVPRVDIPMGNEELYSAVGYGYINASGEGAGVRRRIDGLTSVCVESYCGQPTLQNEWIGPGKMCEGDSGGPAIDGLNRQVGIASSYLGVSCESSYSLYSHIYAWADWLKERTVALTQAYGVNTPKWALGWPTDPVYGYEIGGECIADTDCASGLCGGGICSRMCASAAPCPPGFLCEGEPSICVPALLGAPCTPSEDPNNLQGDPPCASGICQDETCTRSCEGPIWTCPESYSCEEGVCTLYPLGISCSEGTQCLSGLCSFEGYCTYICGAEAPCPLPDYHCAAPSGTCELFPVGAPCEGPEDCLSGLCESEVCTRVCDETMVCPPGYLCTDKQVCEADEGFEETDPGCENDSTCRGGWCHEGECVEACDEDIPCPGGGFCEEETGDCLEGIEDEPDAGDATPGDEDSEDGAESDAKSGEGGSGDEDVESAMNPEDGNATGEDESPEEPENERLDPLEEPDESEDPFIQNAAESLSVSADSQDGCQTGQNPTGFPLSAWILLGVLFFMRMPCSAE